jgi:hypothetical protein
VLSRRNFKLGLIAFVVCVGCASGQAVDDAGGGSSGNGGTGGTGGTGATGGSGGIGGSGGTGGIGGIGGSGGMAGTGGTGGMSGSGGTGGTGGMMIDAAMPDAAPPDAAPATCTPRAAVCDPVCNTGCNGAQRCDISATANQGQCISTTGETQNTGQSCTGSATTDTCVAKNSCLGSASSGTCYRLCYVDSDCQQGACCDISITLAGGAASGFSACGTSSTCDPTATNGGGCASGNGCYILPCTTSTANVECACNTASACGNPAGLTFGKTNGASCTYVNECASGFNCVGQTPVCRRTCRLGSNAGCPAANPTCTAIQIDPGPPPVNSTVYGVCL